MFGNRRGRFARLGAMLLSGVAGPAASLGPAYAADLAERMVVTATRQETSLLDQAGSIAVLSGEDVDFIRPDHIAEALNRLPGVYLHRNSGMDHLTSIRSPVLTGGAGAGSFLFLENGVPLRAAGFANVNGLFEAMTEFNGGLEVTRGPGSALYGNNAVHGLINVLLPEPAVEQQTELSASVGSFRRYHGRAQVSGTKGRHGYFAGVNLVSDDGWRQETGVDQQKYLFQWIYDLDTVRVHTTFAVQNLNQESAGFIQGEEAFESSALSRTNPTPDGFRDGRAVRFASRIDWTQSERLTVSFTPYARWNDLDFRLTFVPSQALEESGHWSVGLLSTAYWSFSGGHQIIAGADVEYTEGSLREEQFLPTIFSFTQGLHYDYDVISKVLAGYVEGTWALAPNVTVTGGLRVEYTEYDYTNNTEADIVGRFLRPADREDSFLVATPKLGVVVDLTPTVASYVRYARGARAPQTTDLYRLTSNQTVGDIDVETLDSIELGFRGDIGRRLSFDLAAYYAFKRNFFFRDADGFNVPDGKTQHIGVELEFLLSLTDSLSLALAGAHGRHTYRFDRPVTANSTESIAFGNDVDTAPRLFGTTRVIWTPVEAATLELAWTYLGDYFTDASNSNRYRGHQVLDLRGAWNLTPDLQIFWAVRNLANADYANRADFAFGSARFFPAEDRAVSGGVTVRF